MPSFIHDDLNRLQETLREEGFEDETVFDETLKKLEAGVKKAKKKEGDGDDVMVRLDMLVIRRHQ